MAVAIDRRRFLTTGLALIAAPAIVRAASIMPVRVLPAFQGEIVDVVILPYASIHRRLVWKTWFTNEVLNDQWLRHVGEA
jgi:hypothetical protein